MEEKDFYRIVGKVIEKHLDGESLRRDLLDLHNKSTKTESLLIKEYVNNGLQLISTFTFLDSKHCK